MLRGISAELRPSRLHATYLPEQWPWPNRGAQPLAVRLHERPEQTKGPPGRQPTTGRASASPLGVAVAVG